ncbi:aldolase/citrate lyase family protein [Lichenibacterium dinghuense]|uniref:aldolase/citrate lyase family protein n=1 Tax=Lichenibacterium dinghuense TaxID=2895977 RepID=UPI001F003C8E|nr:aldolase/citrate lyase family protein [Lichenibacterium sp. 6Y81]
MQTLLLLSAGDAEALDAALLSGAEAVALDLGDPHGSGDRAGLRAAALDALMRRDVVVPGRGAPAMMVRVAPLASGLVDADLDAVMAGAPGAVLLPGAVGTRDLQHLAAKLAVREAEHGLAAGSTRIAAAPADTAAGVLALGTLPGATPRLLALLWDPAALASALGVGAGASPVRHARDLLLLAAAAAGVPAIDRGLPGGGLAAGCAAARRDGFAGCVVRRPDEIATAAAAVPRAGQGAPARVDYAGTRP